MMTAWWVACLQAWIAPTVLMFDAFGMAPSVSLRVDLRPRLDQPCRVYDLQARKWHEAG